MKDVNNYREHKTNIHYQFLRIFSNSLTNLILERVPTTPESTVKDDMQKKEQKMNCVLI